MQKHIVFGLMFGLLGLAANAYAEKTDIEFILDVSGSMKHKEAGETQLESARKALGRVLATLPADTHVGLRVYGHRVAQADKENSCKDTELALPMGPVNKQTIDKKIASLTPLGYTPIAYSLAQSKNDFDLKREAKKVIVLLSDGEETCGGHPADVIKDLKSSGFDIVVHTIGINPDAATQKELKAIADAGEGQYFDAKGAQGLDDALKQATQAAYSRIEKTKTTYGAAIRGGDSYETAVALSMGEELKLDHVVDDKVFDYFYLDLKPPQMVTVLAKTLESPSSCVELHDAQRNRLIRVGAYGRNKTDEGSYFIEKEGRYYVLVSCSDKNGNSTFKTSVEMKADLASDKDAGNDGSSALLIEPGNYPVNYVGGSDTKDVFSFNAKKGDKFFIGLIPGDGVEGYFSLSVTNEYKQRVVRGHSPTRGAGFKTEPFEIKEDGRYLLALEGPTVFSKYALNLEKVSNSNAAPSAEAEPQ